MFLHMRICILLLLIILVYPQLSAQQVIISDDKAYQSQNSDAILEIHAQNNNKGILIPRLNTAQRLAFVPDSSSKGLMVFDTESESFWYWTNGQWEELVTESAMRAYMDAHMPDSIVFLQAPIYRSVKEFGVVGDGQTDDTDSLQAAIDQHPGITFFFPDGNYKARINIPHSVILISFTGNVKIFHDEVGEPLLTVNADCKLSGLHFVHNDSTAGSIGLLNNGADMMVENCSFKGYENYVAPQFSRSQFDKCTFTCTDEGLGSLCWSPNAIFTECSFDGVVGADVRDSKFYDCIFSGLWGVHMPDGSIDNAGNPTGYTGTADFYHCDIRGSYYYAIGLGNRAHARMFNCHIEGYTSGAYARTESTFEAYNCYISCTKVNGGSTALKFAKYVTGEKQGIGLTDTGDSYFSNCTFVNQGSQGGLHIIVPNKSDAGNAYFENCSFDIENVCTEDVGTLCQGDIFKYLVYWDRSGSVPHQTLTLLNNEIITPEYSPSGSTYLDLTGSNGAVSGIQFTKLYNATAEFPLGYQLIVRCGSSSNTVSLKAGYNPTLGAGLVTMSGNDLKLGLNEVVTFTYAKNFWIQTSANGAVFTDPTGNLSLDGGLKLPTGGMVNEISDDANLADGSSLAIPTEGAVKTYIDQRILIQNHLQIQTDGLLFVSVPAGCRIRAIVIEETNGNPAGDIRIGSSAGLDDIVAPTTVGGGELIDCQLDKKLFSLQQSQSLFISSSNWGSGKINVHISMEKIF